MQFHLEIEDNTIKKWLSNNSYRESLENEFGRKYLKNLEKKKEKYQKNINVLCGKFFELFIKKLLP